MIFLGDPKDSNYGRSRHAAADGLCEKGYEVIVHEHDGGHTVPRKETKAVFEWITRTIKSSRKKKK